MKAGRLYVAAAEPGPPSATYSGAPDATANANANEATGREKQHAGELLNQFLVLGNG